MMLWMLLAILMLMALRVLGRLWARNSDIGGYPPWPRFMGRVRFPGRDRVKPRPPGA